MKKLGFGTMRLPVTDPKNRGSVNMDELCAMVDMFMERGYRYFDTAYLYHAGQSECAVRKALVERYPRDSFLLADKMPMICFDAHSTPEDQERIFNEQLEKCGVDYFDFYLLHNLNRHEYPKAKRLDTVNFLLKKKQEGKIKKLGFSFHDTSLMLDQLLNEYPQVDFVQLQLNYLDWEDDRIQSRKCYETAVRHGKTVKVMEPIKGGTLASVPQEAELLMKAEHPDWSPSGWALRFIAGLEHVETVLSGMSSLKQLEENTAVMAAPDPLNEKELQILEKVTEIICSRPDIACTACKYCVDKCPKDIPTPDYFALYNREQELLRNGTPPDRAAYREIAKNRGLASQCIRCRQCEAACPQHLPITKFLRQVADAFEF